MNGSRVAWAWLNATGFAGLYLLDAIQDHNTYRAVITGIAVVTMVALVVLTWTDDREVTR